MSERALFSIIAILFLLGFSGAAFSGELFINHNNTLLHYDKDDQLMSATSIPENENSEKSRGIVQLADQRIAVFNGTFSPVLSIYDGSEWEEFYASGWSTVNNKSYGGVAAIPDGIVVTNQDTWQKPEKGLVIFSSDGSSEMVLQESGYINVSLGRDGKLYALRNTYGDLDIVDPDTMTIVSTLDLGHVSGSRAVSADSEGNVYMASWNGFVARYDEAGDEQDRIDIGGNLYDIDVNEDGKIAVGSGFGDVYRLDSSLSGYSTLSVGSSGTFVAWKKTDQPQPDYCESKGLSQHYEWIEAISINGVENVTGNNGGYASFDDPVVSLTAGETHSVQLEPGYSGWDYWENWQIWIDLNRDGEFTNDERLHDSFASGTVSSTLVIPGDVTPGKTRLRVVMSYGGSTEPCGDYTYGETEDYIVEIKEK